MTQTDDYGHAPERGDRSWKENWIVCGLDRETRVASVFHASLRPGEGELVLSAKLAVDGWEHGHVGRTEAPADSEGLDALGDDRLQIRVVEPFSRYEVTYRSDELDADLLYAGRFQPFDFEDGPKAQGSSTAGEVGLSVFPFHHFEQGLEMEGELRPKAGPRAGERLAVRGLGNRDRSWGFRDEFGFRHHHWICASFDDCYVQLSTMLETSYPDVKHGGVVSSAEGNDAVREIDTSAAWWLDGDGELPELHGDLRYPFETVSGERRTLVIHAGHAYARLPLSAKSKDRSRVYEDWQVFCDFSIEETGQTGGGLLEIGKYHEGTDVADRIGSRSR